MTHPTDEELDALVYFLRLAYDETKWTDHFRAGEAITALRAQLAEVQADLTFMTEDRNKWQDSATQRWFRIEEANARADRAEAALAALEPAHHVNETLKNEHDRADVLTAVPAPVAPSLRITGPNSDGEYWLHITAGGRSGGVNLGGEHGPICKRLFDAASETGAKE